MDPQKAHKLGVKASDVQITTRCYPGSRAIHMPWEAWVPHEGRPNGKQVLTQSHSVGKMLWWRNQLERLNDA